MSIQQHKDDPVALRKQLIRMRLELNRQKICHESLVLLEPVQKLRDYKQRLTQGSTPLLIVAGVTLASFFITRNRRSVSRLLPIVRIAASLLPLFMVTPMAEADTSPSQADNLK
ncbi:MAG: hypothetical protein RBR45_01800 [Pseudomonas sp.]|jgi:hypothetical protein|nr:hypothetical protein [Pseudomonas sp.]